MQASLGVTTLHLGACAPSKARSVHSPVALARFSAQVPHGEIGMRPPSYGNHHLSGHGEVGSGIGSASVRCQASGTTQNAGTKRKIALVAGMALAAAVCVLAISPPPALAAAKGAAVAATESAPGGVAGLLKGALSFILHLDKHLVEITAHYGATTYGILWAIVFCETGLVVTPFLPGDSLLFATGALAALGALKLAPLVAVYLSAAILGDAVNYALGSWLGAAAVESGKIKKEHIKKTEEFYDKYGGKTVVLARFVPIVRTFAPFVAGIGSMEYKMFAVYNVVGAFVWTLLFVGAGYFFGNLPAVQHNFTLVVLGIVVMSVLPIIYEVYQAKREAARAT